MQTIESTNRVKRDGGYWYFDGIKVDDEDILIADIAYPWEHGYSGSIPHPFLIHEYGFIAYVVWASNLQDALDTLADSGKLDHSIIEWEDISDEDKERFEWSGSIPGYSPLGNASELFGIENFSCVEFSNEDIPCRLMVQATIEKENGYDTLASDIL